MQLIQNLWSNYIIHAIDVLIVAYIFYRLMLLVKGTRAVQIIIGILTLVVLTFFAKEILHLTTLNWLLERFWLAAVVILIVVFQPEIRSALAQLGSHKWGKILISSETGFINEIIEAVIHCTKYNMGCLIVLEQETGLRTYIEAGVIINAQISHELILSIFNPKAPMHDGAVIVKDARLIAAGCVLPLSHEPGISKVLGTRHRAAIGLSEISDAVIVVVSEETGNISIARRGKLESNVEPEELRRRLLELYKESVDKTLLTRMPSKEVNNNE